MKARRIKASAEGAANTATSRDARNGRVSLGIERLVAAPGVIGQKRTALLSHQAAVTHDFRRSLDVLAKAVNLVRVFAPEHGFWGVRQDMTSVSGQVDDATGIKIVELYADYPKLPMERTPEGIRAWQWELARRKQQLWPRPEDLSDIDILIVDLQDIGTRYYTFANTMAYCMEVAKTTGTKVIVCDRPNPINGLAVEGNLVDEALLCFVGQFQIPPRHGMTIGELARFFQIADAKYNCELSVVQMEGWQRAMWWDDTGLYWIPPSPNVNSLAAATVYPGTCLIESTLASEGRGTGIPFQIIGAPGISLNFAEALNSLRLPGVYFRACYFQPTFHKHAGRVCGGAQLIVTDRSSFQPYRTGLWCLKILYQSWPDFSWRRDAYEYEAPDDKPALEQLVGTRHVRAVLENGDDLDAWAASWDTTEFMRRRQEVLLY